MNRTATYFNTNAEHGAELSRSKFKVKSQQDAVLAFFCENPMRGFTPFDIQRNVLPGTPITSIRRAITNLAQAGKLKKTESMGRGRYGKKNYLWVYKRPDMAHIQTGLF